MTIPYYETLKLPLLQFVADGQERSVNDVAMYLERMFDLTDAEIEERIPSGQSIYIKNRTGWARTYLKKAELLSSPRGT